MSAGPVSGALSAAEGGWGAAVSHPLGAPGSAPRWFWWSVREGPGVIAAGVWEGFGWLLLELCCCCCFPPQSSSCPSSVSLMDLQWGSPQPAPQVGLWGGTQHPGTAPRRQQHKPSLVAGSSSEAAQGIWDSLSSACSSRTHGVFGHFVLGNENKSLQRAAQPQFSQQGRCWLQGAFPGEQRPQPAFGLAPLRGDVSPSQIPTDLV